MLITSRKQKLVMLQIIYWSKISLNFSRFSPILSFFFLKTSKNRKSFAAFRGHRKGILVLIIWNQSVSTKFTDWKVLETLIIFCSGGDKDLFKLENDTLHKKWIFLNDIREIRISLVMKLNLQFPADLLKFATEIINGKLHFLCSDNTRVTTENTWHGYVAMFSRLTIFEELIL